MQLSPHFALNEFVSPNDPIQMPPSQAIANLRDLCASFLEPLRNACGHPLTILSGWRSPEHNASPEVGGAPTSQHLYGKAADIFCSSLAEQIRLAAKASRLHGCGGMGIYAPKTLCHLDIRPTVNGKITTWYQDAAGNYTLLPESIRAGLVAAGAEFLG